MILNFKYLKYYWDGMVENKAKGERSEYRAESKRTKFIVFEIFYEKVNLLERNEAEYI